MSTILNLYRGDNYLNDRTQPGLYRANGLRSKAFTGRSDPGYISKQGLLDTIRKHVNPTTVSDKTVYDVTAYLSFSEDESKAVEWAGGSSAGIVEVDDYKETRYVFHVSIPTGQLTEIFDSIFEFHYPCNPGLKKSDALDPLNIVSPILQKTGCKICDGIRSNHSVLLIDTVSFLAKHLHLPGFNEAYKNSVGDKEWLLLPNDPMGSFQSARIPRANFWSAKHYRLITESSRN